MKIKILGSACTRCEQLHVNALTAARRVGASSTPVEVEKVNDPDELYKSGVFITPGLIIDDEVVSAGKLLTPDQIEAEIKKRRAD
jgi:small redox-active disulfide protein 2